MTQGTTPYEMIGGQEKVASIVKRFYDLIDSDPAYADLRAMHAKDLTVVQHGLTQFLTGWLGGPRDWFERGGCVMSVHRPMAITSAIASEWRDAMTHAVTKEPDLDPQLATAMAEALGHMALGMINLESEVEGHKAGAVG